MTIRGSLPAFLVSAPRSAAIPKPGTVFRANRIGRPVFSLCLFVVGGCVVTCKDYEYMSFRKEPNVVVSETGIPEIEGLSRTQPFPVSYAITKQQYNLRLDMIRHGVKISLAAKNADQLILKGLPVPFRKGNACYSWTKRDGSLFFGWLARKGCDDQRDLHFEVIDAVGMQIAEERIGFDLVKNGRYCFKDAL